MFPLPSVTRATRLFAFFAFDFILILPFPVIAFRFSEPLPDQLNFFRWCRDAFRGLLLKYVQNIDGVLKTHGINSPPRITAVRGYNFQHARSPKAFERFSRRIDSAFLGSEERMSNVDSDLARKGA
jgi:hypothetical protein